MPKISDDEPCPCGSGRLFRDCHGSQIARQEGSAHITIHVRLQVVPEPDPGSATVFEKSGEGSTIFQGLETGVSQDCGSCGAPLIVGLSIDQVQNIALKCNACGSFNLAGVPDPAPPA